MIYPIKQLCFFNNFDWSLSEKLIDYLNFHYEIWAKGGIGPGYSVSDKSTYIDYLNWVPNWLSVYFYGKFTDYILVVLLIIAIFFFLFKRNFSLLKKNKNQISNKDLILFFCFFIIFLLWFLNFPTLRYGGYPIVTILIIFPFIFLNKKIINIKNQNVIKKIIGIFIFSYLVFLSKNVLRLDYELKLTKLENNNFNNFPFFWVKKNKFKKVSIQKHYLYLTEGSCWSTPSTCIRSIENINIRKKNDYIFYLKNKKN